MTDLKDFTAVSKRTALTTSHGQNNNISLFRQYADASAISLRIFKNLSCTDGM